jgi:galactitol-specific phosphotransferase system IIB component
MEFKINEEVNSENTNAVQNNSNGTDAITHTTTLETTSANIESLKAIHLVPTKETSEQHLKP